MSTFLYDLRHAIRMFARDKLFAGSTVVLLALAIGANTALFSVFSTVILHPLPYPDPDRLVTLTNVTPQGLVPGTSTAKFNHWRNETATFRDVAAYRYNVMNYRGSTSVEQLSVGQVSHDFFRLFGVPFLHGRPFTAQEDLPDSGQFAVVSEGFWRRALGAEPELIGRAITLNDTSYTVVGVTGPFDIVAIAPGFDPPDVWIPFQIDPAAAGHSHFFANVARLNPGVSLDEAIARLRSSAEAFRRQFPSAMPPDFDFTVEPLQDALVGGVRPLLWFLMIAVILVLFVACANAANLLLARATMRRREIALRAAIGATRGRIVRQLITETTLLVGIAGALGLVVGAIGVRTLLAIDPGNIPRIGPQGASVTLDWRVFVFTLGTTLITGVLFGLVPAIGSSREDVTTTLKEHTSIGHDPRRRSARALLVVAEIGITVVLLVGAALLVRTFAALRAVETGVDATNVLTMRMSATGPRFADTAAVAQLVLDGVERLRALPGVDEAAAACCLPIEGAFGLPFTIEGRGVNEGSRGDWVIVSPTYFDSFKIPLVRGRRFSDRDVLGSPGVAIVNRAMARRFWPNGDPIGSRLTVGTGMGPQFAEPPREIVGVVGDVRNLATDLEPGPAIYVPIAQVGNRLTVENMALQPLAWIVRTRVNPYSLLDPIRRELETTSGGLAIARVRTMSEVSARSLVRANFNMRVMIAFAVSALLLALSGAYAFIAYSVQQRTRELSVRVALGAAPGQLTAMVMGQGMRLVVVGLGMGILAALAATRFVASLVFGVDVRDPATFVGVPLLVSIVVMIAIWIPARRAAHADALVSARSE